MKILAKVITAEQVAAPIKDGATVGYAVCALAGWPEEIALAIVSFSGKHAQSINKPTLFITERAVFELQKEGMVLTEIAPGVDLEKDILALMDFKPIISPYLKLMDEGIFQPTWGKLKDMVKKY